ncbi:hypothetical protein FQA39_LY14337 [Lamprigera yunnana]|nr:hypothetical protein FQA39_LY14337 [Lamprigera yunnana]
MLVCTCKARVCLVSPITMIAKFSVCLLAVCLFIRRSDAMCANILNEEEKQCAEPRGLDADKIMAYYQADADNENFRAYLSCIWTKWNYVNKSGAILYENLLKSDNLPWEMARLCEDKNDLERKAKVAFLKAVNHCKANPPAEQTPFSVRRCISKAYEP